MKKSIQSLQNPTKLTRRIRGNVLFLLIALIVLNLLAPIVTLRNFWSSLYVYIYCITLGTTIIVTSSSKYRLPFGVGAAVVTSVLALQRIESLQTTLLTAVGLLLLTVFLIFVILVLIEFIFTANKVTRDVLYASIVIYLLIANAYAPLYSLMELVQPGSYAFSNIDTSITGSIGWPNFLYFSYATLTTLGFGDIAPVGQFAGMLTISEAVIGVLYIAIMMARLVSLYAQETAEITEEETIEAIEEYLENREQTRQNNRS